MKKPLLTASAIALTAFAAHSQFTQTFNYTGSMQAFTVPPCADSIIVDAKGAQGSPDAGGAGTPGLGGRTQAKFNVTGGNILFIYVGGQGAVPAGGYNGGGDGGSGAPTSPGGGGGGASDIRLNGTALANRIIVASGGGGCGGYNGVNGGNGGGLTGTDGTNGAATAGTAGTQVSGGTGGTLAGSCGTNGTAGSAGTGETGGNTTCTGGWGGGGGGGGGYYGGGGGGCAAVMFCCPDWSGGGGGGSSYTAAGATTVTHTAGFQAGNGTVTVTFVPCPTGMSDDATDFNLSVFPNPFGNSFSVVSQNISTASHLSLSDVTGRIVLEKEIFSASEEINTAELSKGVYILRMENEKGLITKKIVKQ